MFGWKTTEKQIDAAMSYMNRLVASVPVVNGSYFDERQDAILAALTVGNVPVLGSTAGLIAGNSGEVFVSVDFTKTGEQFQFGFDSFHGTWKAVCYKNVTGERIKNWFR